MIRGGFLLVGCGLAVAGCAASHDLQVRAIPDASAKLRYGGGLLAEGRAQLALGSAGLALETFRKLQRESPESADAFAGIAACYQQMGRYDLARANYEFALAYSPHDPALLSALASSLDYLGEPTRAAQVRGEVARLTTPARPRMDDPSTVALNVPRLSSVTVKLPAAAPVSALVSTRSNVPVSVPTQIETPPVAAALPPRPTQPRPADQQSQAQAVRTPYLERLGRSEVALITTSRPVWSTELASRAAPARATASKPQTNDSAQLDPEKSVRWVSLRYAGKQDIRILNAARSEGLAARTRSALLGRGWRNIDIGDARQVRRHSVVLYSTAREATVRRLAAHFDCKAIKVESARGIVVLLGRDAILRRFPALRA